jgi:hypothetical protein
MPAAAAREAVLNARLVFGAAMQRRSRPVGWDGRRAGVVAPYLTVMTKIAPQRRYPLREVFTGVISSCRAERSLLDRQADGHCGAGTLCACDRKRATMLLHDLAGPGEAKAGAFDIVVFDGVRQQIEQHRLAAEPS